jgi:PAS domain S-box-containing protein
MMPDLRYLEDTLEQAGVSKTDEGRYRLLVDAITGYGICMLDTTGIVATWNSGAERVKGYTADEIIGRHFSRFYTEDEQRAELPALALETAAREGRFEHEGWRIRKDGSRIWANVVIDAIRSASGELLGFAEVTQDLAERRQAEASLRKSEEQFKLLVQSVTDYAIFMLDLNGKVASWNAGAQRIIGYLPTEIIGQHFSRFYTDEARQAGMPALGLETARREGRWEREGLRVRKDGSTFWSHVVIDAIRDESGEVVGFAKITRDITERKLAQAELEKAREALFQAQKMDAIGQFTGGVAHDFNNLLMVALSSLELLRKRLSNDSRVLALIDNAMQALKGGSTLIERMLTFARHQELKFEPIQISVLLQGMHGFLQRSIGPTVRIDSLVPTDLPSAFTDANHLETAILNLALNARDAMSGAGVITISGRVATAGKGNPTLRPGDYVVVSVADTGEGMDAATVEKAAEPFFTTKGVGKGTGLGLAMVHGLAVQSGGMLVIKSTKGEGTTVEVWLPVSGEASATVESAGVKTAAASDSQLVVMLVDDDSLVLTNTAALLEDLGHFVITASSASEAFEAMKLHPAVGVVITDYAMPKINGLELATSIRRDWPGVPIILATGYADVIGREASDVLRLKKPFTQEQIQDILTQAIGTVRMP